MKWHKPSRRSIIVALIIVGIFVFPVRYPLITVEPDYESSSVFELHKNQSLVFQFPASTNLSMLTFWIRSKEKIPLDTPLELHIVNSQTGVEKRLKKATFASVYDAVEKRIRFPLVPLNSHENSEWKVTLAAPQLEPAQALLLEPPLADMAHGSAVAFGTRTTLTLTSALFRSIFAHSTEGQDIQYYWHRGGIISQGGNPYACVLDDTCIDHKNPGHFPLFYWLSALSQKMGLKDFDEWIGFWRPAILSFWVGTAFLIFAALYRRQQHTFAFFGAFFWLFNRWSLYVAKVGQIEFIAIFFLVASVLLLRRRFWLALFLFSISLALKQVGIFLLPLYLIYAWHKFKTNRLRGSVLAGLAIGSIPLISLLPFLAASPKAIFIGLLFSVVRTPGETGAVSFDTLLDIPGAVGIIPMLLLMGLIYISAFRQRLPIMMTSLLIFMVFLAFNAVLFNQYFPWVIPFLPLAASEMMLLAAPRTKDTSHKKIS